MRIIQNITIVLCTIFILSACSEEKPKDEYKLIEYLKVEGTCSENHVKESANYAGSLVHWYNVTEDRHYRYGSVQHTASLDPERIIEKVKNPYKYYPPFSIDFMNITPDNFSKEEVELKGISEHTPKGQSEEGARYEATCKLRVIERLDHLPSDKEQHKKR